MATNSQTTRMRFLRNDLQDELGQDLRARNIPHVVEADGTIRADDDAATELEETWERILEREISGFNGVWLADDSERDQWRTKMLTDGIRFVECQTEIGLEFFVERRELEALDRWARETFG